MFDRCETYELSGLRMYTCTYTAKEVLTMYSIYQQLRLTSNTLTRKQDKHLGGSFYNPERDTAYITIM